MLSKPWLLMVQVAAHCAKGIVTYGTVWFTGWEAESDSTFTVAALLLEGCRGVGGNTLLVRLSTLMALG